MFRFRDTGNGLAPSHQQDWKGGRVLVHLLQLRAVRESRETGTLYTHFVSGICLEL